MPDLCCAYTFAGGTINPSSGDGLVLQENGIVGLDGRPIRAQIDNKGRNNGGKKHPSYFGPRIIAFSGGVLIRSVALKPTSAYYAALMTVEDAWIALLEAKLNTPDTLAWTPSNGGSRSLSCTYGSEGGEISFFGSMLAPKFHFTLVAETG